MSCRKTIMMIGVLLVGLVACQQDRTEVPAGTGAASGGTAPAATEASSAADPTPQEEGPVSTWDFGVWDTDEDDLLTENELAGGFEEITLDWDGDGDDALSQAEMAKGMHSLWDTDDDGTLEVSEFEEGAERWFGDRWDYAGFRDVDSDGDNELTVEEYDAAIDDMKVFDDLDENDDEAVQPVELAGAYDGYWDGDGDGDIEAVEWADRSPTAVGAVWAIAEWDANDDQLLTENELVAGFEGIAIDWDEDGDRAISDVEMTNGLFALWDDDGNDRLEVSEFEEGAERWFGDRWDYAGVEDLDADGDKELTLEEYDPVMDDIEIYDDLDENDDDLLQPSELAAGYETYWDADDDGQLEAVEWEDFG